MDADGVINANGNGYLPGTGPGAGIHSIENQGLHYLGRMPFAE